MQGSQGSGACHDPRNDHALSFQLSRILSPLLWILINGAAFDMLRCCTNRAAALKVALLSEVTVRIFSVFKIWMLKY
jgi:hypothetical protein